MRPYLAIIKDSFRAALHSKVLYVLLLLITILLVGIAPFRLHEVLDWEIGYNSNVSRPHELVIRLVERKDDERYPEMGRVWEMLSDGMKNDLQDVYDRNEAGGVLADPDMPAIQEFDPNGGPPMPRHRGLVPAQYDDEGIYRALVNELNERVIKDEDFYREEDWESRTIRAEADDLVKQGSLSTERSRRLNRLLLADAFGSVLEDGSPTSLDFYYLHWKIEAFSTNTTHEQFASGFSTAIPFIFDKFVLSVGLVIAILITASIIPETFDPGSLNLLLSKPVSRSGLLVAKFFGGCAFVALCSVYLFVGVYMWLGLAMKYWDPGILISIPIYILAFAIYYSVSTMVGLIFRSAILAVILTAIFWGLCFGIGSLHGFFDTRMENTDISRIVPLENDKVLHVDPIQRIMGWDGGEQVWANQLTTEMPPDQEAAIGMVLFMDDQLEGMPDNLGPIYDEVSGKVFATAVNIVDPTTLIGQRKCFVSDPDKIEFEFAGHFPLNTVNIFETNDGLLCVTSGGEFYRLNLEALEANAEAARAIPTQPVIEGATNAEESVDAGETGDAEATTADDGAEDEGDDENDETTGDEAESTPERARPALANLFTRVNVASPVTVRNGTHVAYDSVAQQVVIYRRGTVTVFEEDGEGGYRPYASVDVDTGLQSNLMSAQLEARGNTILLALGNGQLITIDSTSMQEKNGYLPETRAGLDQMCASEDGRFFALLYANEELWMLDTEKDGSIEKASFPGQGKISAVAFDGSDKIWIGDREDRATLYEISSGKQIERLTPDPTWWQTAHRVAIDPVYQVFPKPGELYKVVTHLSSTQDTRNNREVDLAGRKPEPNPWSPLWSGLGFMAVMLLLGCIYFHFKDF
ncbi:MAG: ABC transporter permease [Planctomycetota bacterium]